MNKNARTTLPFRRDACASSSDDVCSREIKREFFDKFPLKRKGGRREGFVVLSVAKEKD